ncbi:MAG: phosphatase PAP2 family protein [Candidatus Berkelbacteria bacterium]|nr:phosphatase PAP2 family protein [Candidatus Berkelbacteria bacterium]
MIKKPLEIVSLILNPLFLALILILLGIEESNLSKEHMMVFTLAALILNGFLPIYFIYSSFQKGIVIDDTVKNKEVIKNRSSILAKIVIIFFAEIIALSFYHNPEPLYAIVFALALLNLALFIINMRRKVSLHAAGVTAFALVVLALFGWSFWLVIVLIPVVFWSRFYLLRHTKKQLLAGFFTAIFITLIVFYYFNLLGKL